MISRHKYLYIFVNYFKLKKEKKTRMIYIYTVASIIILRMIIYVLGHQNYANIWNSSDCYFKPKLILKFWIFIISLLVSKFHFFLFLARNDALRNWRKDFLVDTFLSVVINNNYDILKYSFDIVIKTVLYRLCNCIVFASIY